ncbi:MGDG synthase family glycosyltransferase [Cytobacillus sp. IB215665]|uniref:MGDG synthase family glycosyltransferase n=1 Tax=Cytobacillus sp. IB215665 TaxID=3097357 RepID=UPI002A174E12|nr:galactosyldiacylglycerol synthase [Cytobacillus sp. IB215665]MDX8364651.1 galactosyldiacylglycerol synthase [Cytobacillus sp. IB215665]
MKKILFLPLLSMPSGHHQVAESLIHSINRTTNGITTNKVDLLSYSHPALEKLITAFYLKWIKVSPKTYKWAYNNFGYSKSTTYSLQWYERLFLKNMEQLIQREQPDVIVATHGFPSFLVSRLKQKRMIDVPLINVYTDFFINNVWGRDGVDYHFVPSEHIRTSLIEDSGVTAEKIVVTGIPINDKFNRVNRQFEQKKIHHILLAGGSCGLGNMVDLLREIDHSAKHFHFSVLCGNNVKMYEELTNWKKPYITPLQYLSSRDEMNDLYENVDAIVTKPGGVTVSEALHKKLPIFAIAGLPGQEEINLSYLQSESLVYKLDLNMSISSQIIEKLTNKQEWNEHQQRIEGYVQTCQFASEKLLTVIKSINNKKVDKVG